MNANPRRNETDRTSPDEETGPAPSNPSNAGGERREAINPDDVGIPTGYLERSFESKRFPTRRTLRSDRQPNSR